MLRIHLFGSLRLFDGDQPLKFSAPPKTLPLFVYLLLRRAGPVSRDQLAFLLWPDDSEREARSNLRRHLHHLQRALPPAPPDRPWLLAEAGDVQWNPAGDWWLDVAEFQRLSAEPEHLAEAVALVTGDLLPTLYDDWAIVERESLRDAVFDALRELIRQRRAANDLRQAIAFARQLLLRDPLHEETLRDLMTLQTLSGDRAGALQEFQRFEHRLREELNVAPMPETQALYASIREEGQLVLGSGAGEPGRKGDAAYSPIPSSPPAPVPPSSPAPLHNLPAQLTTFVGREEELAQVRHLICPPDGPARLLTLTGPGGSGKTRLALEAAARLLADEPRAFPDGTYVIRLAAINDPALVAGAIEQQLGLQESELPSAEQLRRVLRPRRTLLLLDNFEQVAEAAPLVADLLTGAPGLRVMVTSRAVLRLYGEVELPVPPLPLPDLGHLPAAAELMHYAAIALFVERARAADRRFALTEENAAQVAEICARLDGLPLALELAAARSKMFTPAAMLARLSSRLEFLGAGQPARTAAARQQTLRQTIDWSYNLLTPAEQTLFARLGVFVGAFTLEAAEVIAGEPGSSGAGEMPAPLPPSSPAPTLDLLASLIDQSMVRPETTAIDEPRFRVLLTLREYGLGRLAEAGELEQARERHARYYLALAEQAAPELRGPAQADWVSRLQADHDNLRAALSWFLEKTDDGAEGMRLFAALGHFWHLRSHQTEGRRWLEQALARWPDAPLELRARAEDAAGLLALTQGDYTAAQAMLERAMLLWQGAGPAQRRGKARNLRNLGLLAWTKGDLALADSYHEQSLALAREAGDQQHIANMLNSLGLVAHYRGDLDRARAHYGESLAVARASGDLLCVANVLNNLGIVAYEQGKPGPAQERLAEALAMFGQLGHLQGVAIAFNNLGNAQRNAGDLAAAEASYENSLAADREHRNEAHTAYPLFGLGATAYRRGDVARALEYFEKSLDVRNRYNDRRGVAQCLDGFAWVLTEQDQADRATRLLGAAEAIRETVGEPPHPVDIQGEHEAAVAKLQAALSPAEFAAAWQAGRTLSLDEAVELAVAGD